MVKAIICDFDGVNRKILPIGIMVYLRGIRRLGFWRSLEILEVVCYLFFQEFLAYFGLILGVKNISPHHFLRKDSIPGSVAVLEALKLQGYKLGMVTNRKRAVLEWHAGRLGLDLGLFDLIIARDGSLKKPNPQVFAGFFRLWNLSPAEMLYVGDRYELDYLGASRAGLAIAMVCSGFTTYNDFLKLGVLAEEIIPSLSELPAYLPRRNQD